VVSGKSCYIVKRRMRYAIIADIHANLTAFNAVLNDIERRGGMDEIWCLGDIVGYGPDPQECIELLQQYNHVCVAGNHDLAAIGKIDTAEFNPDAAIASHWTTKQLGAVEKNYLENLPLVIEKDNFTLVHGSPREPIWEYLLSISGARESFNHFQTQFCLVGHSHVPLIFRHSMTGGCSYSPFSVNVGLFLGKDRLIINPGGVGQPRDNDPRASYAMYDTEAMMIKLYRVSYNVNTTQNRMVKHNLPMRLVARLNYGM